MIDPLRRTLTQNRVAQYVSGGSVEIASRELPLCPDGGLLVDTLACGLCSGELMAWYMERKAPHILGHEVSGRVIESQNAAFPVGSLVFPHHHAPCLNCDMCRRGRYVHCETWRKTKLHPGGMADRFAVPEGNLADTLDVSDLRPVDSALIEPLACVMKSLRMTFSGDFSSGGVVGKSEVGRSSEEGQSMDSGFEGLPLTEGEGSGAAAGSLRRNREREPIADLSEFQDVAVIGLGSMGLMHMLMLPKNAHGYDLNPKRVEWARSLGLQADTPESLAKADAVIVCPGSQAAFDAALKVVRPGGTIVMFAPMPPDQDLRVPQSAYFNDVTIRHSYSCGPDDTRAAAQAIRAGRLKAGQVISAFIAIEDLPAAYAAMKLGETLKPMVIFK